MVGRGIILDSTSKSNNSDLACNKKASKGNETAPKGNIPLLFLANVAPSNFLL